MAPLEQQRPCIHVCLFPGTNSRLFRMVAIGSEEEGVPCRMVEEAADDLVSLAFAAAQSSRFNIGVGVSDTAVVLHETHMPPRQPVLTFKFSDQADYSCRLMGSNAARMIIRKPFRLDDEPAPFFASDVTLIETTRAVAPPTPVMATEEGSETVDPQQIAKIVTMVIQKLRERGIR